MNYPYANTSHNYGDFFPRNNEVQDLKKSLSKRDGLIATLMQKAKALEDKSESKTQKKSTTSTEKQNSISKKIKSSSQSKKRKVNKSLQAPKKCHPLQMLACEVPEDFNLTKDAMFVHIKILWGMLEEHEVPPKPDNSLLKEFNQQFSTNEQLKNAATSQTGGNIITKKEVQTLRDACAGRKKVGKHIVYLENFYFLYICSFLSKLRICVWAPDLEKAPGFFYNEACCTVAIMTFRQLACSGAYQYM
ncbi:hypothetical protein O181_007215 [Austropuccinia psidii MF-1]|uniref:Uncharacterized protein n=1 Tax=Austropuccinia psidii MF-1 TaxID=1389203 RepID=A0A9Q3GHM7_9BASI|nr:hypothetical protein [Austropuccinia psidii MF-1]